MVWFTSYFQQLFLAAACIGAVSGLSSTTSEKCDKATHGKIKLYENRNGDDEILICAKKSGVYRWRFINGAPSLGEKFDPARDCSDIVDNVPNAKDDFYWITLSNGKVMKVWCDVHTDGGGFMLIGMQDRPSLWSVPFTSNVTNPEGPAQWSNNFGDQKVLDFAIQISSNNSLDNTQAHWLYRLDLSHTLGSLLGVGKKVCTDVHSGIGNIVYVKDILTNTVVTKNLTCSKFGPYVDRKLGWGRVNYCFKHNCPAGYAFIPGFPLRLDSFGSFSYSTGSQFSGVTHDATAFVGCDKGKCCACYGPKGGRKNYCAPECRSTNGGTVTKQAYVWFWIRTSMPKRVWKRCMDFKMETEEGKIETYSIDTATGSTRKGSCSDQFHTFLNEGTLSVSKKENLGAIPNVPGLLSYCKDNSELYVNNGSQWEALGNEREMNHLDAKVDVWINTIKRLEKKLKELEGRQLYALHFQRQDIRDYAISSGDTPSMNSITACLWMKSSPRFDQQSYVSYATPKADNSFLLYASDLHVFVMGSHSSTGVKTNDGKWHHICATWTSSGGKYTVYKDGSVASQGTISGTSGKTILGGGTWVLGQEQDKVGGSFQPSQGFVGDITGVNIWDRVLSREAIKMMSKSCKLSASGNVKSWNTFKYMIRGNVKVVKPKLC